MRLESERGSFIELTVRAYEFPNHCPAGDDDWDANWLTIHGRVSDGAHHWEFTDPCLTTWEARELAAWLRAVGQAPAGSPDGAARSRLAFTEPTLRFAATPADDGFVALDVDVSAASGPIRGPADGHRVRLGVTVAAVEAAAADWERELAAFPIR